MEVWIDRLDGQVPILRQFILPGGGLASCHFHLARTATRTAERRVASLVLSGSADPNVLKYLNRLVPIISHGEVLFCGNIVLVSSVSVTFSSPPRGLLHTNKVILNADTRSDLSRRCEPGTANRAQVKNSFTIFPLNSLSFEAAKQLEFLTLPECARPNRDGERVSHVNSLGNR